MTTKMSQFFFVVQQMNPYTIKKTHFTLANVIRICASPELPPTITWSPPRKQCRNCCKE